MRLSRMLTSLALLLFFTALSSATAQDDVSWLLNQINCLRQSVGTAPLTMNVALSIAANRQAVNLANDELTEYHVGLDGSTPTIRAREAGFTGSVGENVAAGRQVSDPFNWWLNSSVHYSNMTNEHWKEIGIGIASGPQGTWYTLVFGAMSWEVTPFVSAPCGTFDAPASAASEDGTVDVSSSGTIGSTQGETLNSDSDESPAALPTPVILGLDEHGYIQHQIQSGETPGTIMLSYGYAWEDLPALMALNNMTEADARNLDIGDIFLIPPKDGTFTPVPSDDSLTTPTADEDEGLILLVISDTPSVPSERVLPSLTPIPAWALTPTVTPTIVPTQPVIPSATETLLPPAAFAASLTSIPPTETTVPPVAFVASLTPTLSAPEATLPPVDFTVSATPTIAPPVPESPDSSDDKTPLLLTIAIVLQVIILGVAAFEGVSRWRKRR